MAYFYAETDELADLIYRYSRASATEQEAVKTLLAEIPPLPPATPLKHSPGNSGG